MSENEPEQFDTQSIGARLRLYERRSRTTIWIGAGLAGLIVLITSDVGNSILKDGPSGFRSIILTLLLISGGALALARANYEYAASRVKNRQWARLLPGEDDVDDLKTTKLPDSLKAPKKSEFMYQLSIFAIIAAALTFLLAVWWWFGPWLQESIPKGPLGRSPSLRDLPENLEDHTLVTDVALTPATALVILAQQREDLVLDPPDLLALLVGQERGRPEPHLPVDDPEGDAAVSEPLDQGARRTPLAGVLWPARCTLQAVAVQGVIYPAHSSSSSSRRGTPWTPSSSSLPFMACRRICP